MALRPYKRPRRRVAVRQRRIRAQQPIKVTVVTPFAPRREV